ncbi:hypothetical protein AAHH84_00230 [Candidatus Hodgkinia cicadicola]
MAVLFLFWQGFVGAWANCFRCRLSKIVSALNFYGARSQLQQRLAYQAVCCVKPKLELQRWCAVAKAAESVCGVPASAVGTGLKSMATAVVSD